jgi:hypothetical protein
MRTRIGILLAYLLLGCILLEDVMPYFAESSVWEMCESKAESEEKEAKKEKESGEEWKESKERFAAARFCFASFLSHSGGLLAGSEAIPDSAHPSIFSPPPEPTA